MYETVKAYIKKHHMIAKNETVIAGVSGGADSVCLLCILEKLQKELDFDLVVVHVNHGLRGADADEDEAFVRALCEKRKIPLYAVREDVRAYAKEKGLSEEEAGRELRREAFAKAAERYGGDRIALAHHMDDNAETLLLNLARGTGIRGMSGIRPVNGRYIRPLLGMRRQEIEAWLQEAGETYRTDSTNLEDDYTRNRIRNHVLPYLEERVNQKTVLHMQEFAGQMEALQGYLDRQVAKLYDQCVKEKGQDLEIALEPLQAEDSALWPYLIRRVIAEAAGREKDITAAHVRDVQELCSRQSGRKVSLPYGLEAVKSYETIQVRKRQQEEMQDEIRDESILLCEAGQDRVERVLGNGIHLRVFSCTKIPDTIEERPYTKWFDYDIIRSDVVLRKRRSGDILQIDREGHTQKLKQYFINGKIPKEQREQIPLVAAGSEILWIVGYRQNQKYQVTADTKRILEIQWEKYGGEEDGRDN